MLTYVHCKPWDLLCRQQNTFYIFSLIIHDNLYEEQEQLIFPVTPKIQILTDYSFTSLNMQENYIRLWPTHPPPLS